MNNWNPGWGPNMYGPGERIVYVPVPSGDNNSNNKGSDDPIEALEKQVRSTQRLVEFMKSQNKEEKKKDDAKKVLGLSDGDVKWALILTAPFTGWLMCNVYVHLLTHWPSIVK